MIKFQEHNSPEPAETITVHSTSSGSTCSTEKGNASLVRFLIHNTMPYAVRSLICFVHKGKTVADYFISKLCQQVFGAVSLPFLESVYSHKVEIMSYYRKLRMYPNIGRRTDHCLACNKTGGGCECPTLDVSFHLFCRKKCDVSEFVCKCKVWIIPATQVCYDFFFCDVCAKYYKDSSQYK